jgi:FAD/FMN-containing dehydrogenase
VRVRIDPPSLEELRFRLRGELYEPGAAEYEDTCTLFNSTVARQPTLVARCTAAEDVVAALAFAREHGLEVAVRAGGHSVTGHSLCDGGLVIDLRGMRDIDVNLRDEVVRIGGGATWTDVDHATRRYGLACGNLLAAQLVTAEGEIVFEAPGDGSELLRALLGWGNDLGVVTSLDLRLRPLSS